ncbi:MAG: FtsQ-type POTRA domain-containing protein [Atopobiaceae bacterium]|nr:FtsQ-type POTRA domain-containing protein [Atopobiaceae bacterium]
MSIRDSKRGERRSGKAPSVVGSRLSEITSNLPGRAFIRNKLRDQEGLRIIEGSLSDVVEGRDMGGDLASRVLRIVVIVTAVLVVLLISIAIALAILSTTSAFKITNVLADDTEHVKGADIVQLASVQDEATLLNIDESTIEENVRRNPWVASVDVQKVFPNAINLKVTERKLGSVVAMGSGGLAWLMGDDQIWIEPLRLEVDESESANDEALKQADALGAVLITDVPSSVQPSAGSPSTDSSILTAFSIMWQLSFDFRERVVCYSASSEDDISCLLDNGVEVSFGSDSNVSAKESVAKRILEEFAGQVTYINVRVPTRPSYRRIESEYVKEGSGATGSAVDQEPALPGKRQSAQSADAAKKSGSAKDENKGQTSADQDASGEYTDSDESYDTTDYDEYSTEYEDYSNDYTSDEYEYYEDYDSDDSYGYDEYEDYDTYDYGDQEYEYSEDAY